MTQMLLTRPTTRLSSLCTRCRRAYSGAGIAPAASRAYITSSVAPAPAVTATAARTLFARHTANLKLARRALSILSKGDNTNAMSSLYGDDTPDSIKNSKGLHLITQSTPNGQKVQIFLEELKEAYGDVDWDTTVINIGTNEQKKDWFLRLDPNGRIPVLVDNSVSPPFTVMETSAELLYLEKKYDKDDKFGFKDPLERNEALQWLFFWHGSGAPYQGQLHHFARAAPEKLEYAINRFHNETLRVFGVLEIRLSGKYTGEPREYLAGKGKGKYSVADIGTWTWVNIWEFSGFTEEERAQFPHLKKWIDRIGARPAVQKGKGDKYSKDSTDSSVTKWKLE